MTDHINRRGFFKRATGAGVLLAVSQLPSFAEDMPQVFPDRGKFERLSMAYAVVEIGLDKPFSVLHISDTHLTAAYPHEGKKKQALRENRTKTFGGRQEEALKDSLLWAKNHVDYVLHTGDLIDWQSEANLDLVRKYIGNGITGCMGNHEFSPDMWLSEPKEERSEAYKEKSRKTLQNAFPYDISFQAQIVGGVNFICLDNVYGTVTPQQVKLFKKEVKRGLPIVLCMHVPFFTECIWRAQQRFWKKTLTSDINAPELQPYGDYKAQLDDKTTRQFIKYLKQEPLLKAILSGHIHITIEEQFSPTARQYTVAGNFLFHGREILFV
ncbi:MAG: metallophosphoesterase family protein [Bacteroidaceae bacterium]